MCMIDDGERCDVWRERIVRARTGHRCAECARQIGVGESYRRINMVYCGTADTVKQCRHCMVAADWLSRECGGYLVNGIYEDIADHAQEYHPTPFALKWLEIGMRAGWRKRDGSMHRIPSMPPLSAPMQGKSA